VVLAICSSALRRYLADAGELPDEPLVAAVPVSLRAPGDDTQNTQATMFRVPLATHIADPIERYHAILEATAQMKRAVGAFKSVIPTDFPSIGMPWLLPGLASLYGRTRLADRIRPPANLVISNVPGPRVPLYMAGARMLTYWPASIVVHGMALNITVESYVDTLYFGLTACSKAVPDAGKLADYVRDAHRELMKLAAKASKTGEPRANAAAKAPRVRTAAAAAVTTRAHASPRRKGTAPAPRTTGTPARTSRKTSRKAPAR